MEVVKEFCTHATAYSSSQLQKSVSSLQVIAASGELPPQAVKSLIARLSEVFFKYK